MMEKYKVSIKGTRPILFNRFVVEESDKMRKKGTYKSPEEEAEKSLYRDEKKRICTPSTHIEGTMMKSAVDFTFKGKKTYKDAVRSGIMVDPLLIPHEKQEMDILSVPVIINRGRVVKSRAKLDDWSLTFVLNIVDERLTGAIVKEILSNAGKFIGIGDWRPKYGLFEVVKFERV